MNNSCSLNTRYLAELFGTLVLVFMGVGSAIFAGTAIGNLGVSLTFGFTLLALAYAIGPVSGCHVNPAVSLGMLLIGKINAKETIYYIIAQLIGATVGAGLIYYIATGKMDHTTITNLGANGYDEYSPNHYNIIAVALTEALMTALLLIVVFSTTNKKFNVNFGGVVIGLTVAIIHLVSIPISNTSVNFARSFGPAIIQQGWAVQQLWLFGLAQFIGVIIAVAIYKIIYCHSCKNSVNLS